MKRDDNEIWHEDVPGRGRVGVRCPPSNVMCESECNAPGGVMKSFELLAAGHALLTSPWPSWTPQKARTAGGRALTHQVSDFGLPLMG